MTTEDVRDSVKEMSSALGVPVAAPRGRKLAEMQEYLGRYSSEQLTEFYGRLKKSHYVRTGSFTLDRLVRNDIVTELLVGSAKVQEVISKYYKVKTLVIRR